VSTWSQILKTQHPSQLAKPQIDRFVIMETVPNNSFRHTIIFNKDNNARDPT